MDIIKFAFWVVVVAWAAAFAVILADKWGIREWLQVHADAIVNKIWPRYDGDFFNRLFTCNFCCGWWVAVIISLTLFVITGQWPMLVIPFCSTPITRKLI